MTPFALNQGILGIEAIHNWRGLVDLNTQTGLPRIEVDRVTGLHALPEADDNREPATGRIGEVTYPSLPRGKTITYEGTIYGRTLYDLRAHSALLRGACAERSAEGWMQVNPDPTIGGAALGYAARVLALDMDDEQTVGVGTMPSEYQRHFVLSLRQSDPRYYQIGAPVQGTAGQGVVITVINLGYAPAEPVWIVDGPVADDLVFERYDNPDPRKVLFNSVGLAAGQQLRLDQRTRTLTRVSDGVDFTSKLVFADSSWWDEGAFGLNPGATQVRSAGGGNWTITFDPATW